MGHEWTYWARWDASDARGRVGAWESTLQTYCFEALSLSQKSLILELSITVCIGNAFMLCDSAGNVQHITK